MSDGQTSPIVELQRQEDGVAVLRLDHPKVNALSSEMLRQLFSAARALKDDPPGAVVVTGGPKVFAAGADISEFSGPAEARVIGDLFLRAFNAVADIPRATIAAVSGFALGGGCELALACDFRIASDRATFGQPEVLLGIIPGGGGTQRLARLIGPARAKDLIFSGRQIKAAEALAIGLVDEVVPHAEVHDRALARAAELARGAVAAQALAKRAIDRGFDSKLGAGLDLEQQLFVEVFGTEDARIGVESFKAHGPGKAEFQGR
jgi:enoyl-CoA hydratase/carnithine racemase